MHPLDWAIVVAYLAWVLYDGISRSKNTHAMEGYFLASRSLPWWAVGLSVMATQMSAITLVGTTGQGATDGMRFVQFYFGLPIAMIILSVTLVPFFHRAKVFTAYEYLEQRFDAKTRALASLLFLVQRGLSVGVIISAPAVILAIVLGQSLPLTILVIAGSTTFYTMFGGVQAVAWADVKQMVVIMVGVTAAVVALVVGLPDDVGVEPVLHVAGAVGRLQAIDFTFDLDETYTFWSGLVGGLFLMLGYFGTDQSQVQRYLAARSVDGARRSLLMSGFAKIPLQVLILLMGVWSSASTCSPSRRWCSTARTGRRWRRAIAPATTRRSTMSSGRRSNVAANARRKSLLRVRPETPPLSPPRPQRSSRANGAWRTCARARRR